MLERSLEQKIPIALVYGHHKKQWPATEFDQAGNLEIPHDSLVAIRRTACAGLPHVVQRSQDGSVLVSLEGQVKIWVNQLVPFETQNIIPAPLKAQSSQLEEDTQLDPAFQLMYRLIEKDFRQWIEGSSPQLKDHPLYQKMFQTQASMVSLYTDLVVKDPILKQQVLECDNLNAKVEILSQNKVQQRTQAGQTQKIAPPLHP